MSSSTLYYAQLYLFQIGGPILLGLGVIGSTLNLLVFTRKTLRKSPCAICFVACNITDLLFLLPIFIPAILTYGYGNDYTNKNLLFCRSIAYLGFSFSSAAPSYLILASIDRILITSRNAAVRKHSTRRLAITCIIGIAIFWMIFHIHTFIYMEFVQFGPGYFICMFQPGAYTSFITFFNLVFGVGPPFLMIIFGIWTIKNIRQLNKNAVHAFSMPTIQITAGVDRSHSSQSKDHQLIRMLLMEIIIYILSRCPSTINLIYGQVTQYEMKSYDQISIEQFISTVTYFATFINASVGCYTNMLVSKTFRLELKRIFIENRLVRFFRPQ